jgi:hypothetical protein
VAAEAAATRSTRSWIRYRDWNGCRGRLRDRKSSDPKTPRRARGCTVRRASARVYPLLRDAFLRLEAGGKAAGGGSAAPLAPYAIANGLLVGTVPRGGEHRASGGWTPCSEQPCAGAARTGRRTASTVRQRVDTVRQSGGKCTSKRRTPYVGAAGTVPCSGAGG